MFILSPWLSGHDVELTHLVGKGDGGDEVSSDRDVEDNDGSDWAGDLEDQESNEGQHLTDL